MDCGDFPVYTIDPVQARLVTGDSLPVRVLVNGVHGPVPSVKWLSARPDIARLDTVALAGTPVILRAVAPGQTEVSFQIPFSGGVVTGRVPVLVSARP